MTRDRDRVPWSRTSRVLPLDAASAWALVADVRHHARWVPLTRVDVLRPLAGAHGWEPRPPRTAPAVGDLVVAVSGPGARRGGRGLVDRMRVERFEPPLGAVPGVAVFVKLGPVLGGTARVEVTAAGPDHARVTWAETIHLRRLPVRLTRWACVLFLDGMTWVALRRAAREASASTQRNAV